MKKKFNLFLIIFLLGFFVSGFCFAQTLEVDYPTLPGGEALAPQSSLPEYLIYVYTFGMYLGFGAVFLSLVIAGVLYLVSPVSPETRARAKDYASGALSGLLLLTTLYLITTTINPELGLFKIGEIKKLPSQPPIPPPVIAGVFFYEQSGCPSDSDKPFPIAPFTSSIPDFGPLKNKINSVKIVRDGENAYVSVLYDEINFWGKCEYIDPNTGCTPVKPFAASASVYRYRFDSEPKGKVIFYRKSFHDESGGSKVIKESDIGRIYVKNLNDLRFEDVPKEEQDCIEWDLEGKCTKKEPQTTLAGENITSIKIDGNYIVMLVYFKFGTDTETKWSFCQAFPASDDKNKEGPKQIKWEHIRLLNGGMLPNYVIIIPVKEK